LELEVMPKDYYKLGTQKYKNSAVQEFTNIMPTTILVAVFGESLLTSFLRVISFWKTIENNC